MGRAVELVGASAERQPLGVQREGKGGLDYSIQHRDQAQRGLPEKQVTLAQGADPLPHPGHRAAILNGLLRSQGRLPCPPLSSPAREQLLTCQRPPCPLGELGSDPTSLLSLYPICDFDNATHYAKAQVP